MHISTNFKRFCFLLLLLLGAIAIPVQAQNTYGNEWIKYDQTYHKIKVTQTGIHQLDYAYLSQLGLQDVDPQNLQLFRRGKEVAIYMAGEQDGRLDTQDYLEFYGERNDGALDAELYKDPTHQPHKLYSMYTDTASYFLTISSDKGKRMQLSNPSIEGRTPEPYHIQKTIIYQVDAFYRGKTENGVEYPWFVQGQGYVGSTSAKFEKHYTVDKIVNVLQSGQRPLLSYMAYVRHEAPHSFAVKVKNAAGVSREIAKHVNTGTDYIKGNYSLNYTDITSQGTFAFSLLADRDANGNDIPTNQVSLAMASVTFLQQTKVTGNNMSFYTDSTRSQIPYFLFENASASTVAYDITDPYNIIRTEGLVAGNSKGFVINAQDKSTHKIPGNPVYPVARPARRPCI